VALEWKIDVELDAQRGGTLVVTCPSCKSVHKKQFEQAHSGTEIECRCGLSYRIASDDLLGLQCSLDGLHDTVAALGRSYYCGFAGQHGVQALH
jgi:hypothetical protein